MLHLTLVLSLFSAASSAALTESNLETHVGALSLSASFNPVKDAYWTGYPHHRRTPFAVSPDGKSAYLAYLDSSDTDVHVQQVDPSTFAAVGDAVTVSGAKEAGGLVAHNDGFALLTNEAMPSGTSNAPPGNTPVPVLYRYTSGTQTWKTWLGGPDVDSSSGHAASPDLNGDLVYSEAAKKYGAYFVVTAYDGSASGHFGDNIQYVSDDGTREQITGATSSGFGCSHNTGIAFEAADEPPFASICAEDQGEIWLNTETQYMDGVKISNENTTNGASNEAMGGMSGSYSGLARFVNSDSYIFTWVSKGAKDLTVNDWLGSPYTHSVNRTANRNVAIARFSDKKTIIGDEATSELGANGDSQVNWMTTGTADHSNAHVAVFDGTNALVTWEEIADPDCPLVAFGCKGTFTGSYFQLVNNGDKVGDALKSMDVFVAGDMVTMSDGRICWPYVDMDWSLDGPVTNPSTVTKMSFACMSLDGAGNSTTGTTSTAVASTTAVQTSAVQTAAPSSSTSVEEVADSTAAPVASETVIASSSAAETTTAPQASETALTSFVLVSSGATTTPPSSEAPAATSSFATVPTDSPATPQEPQPTASPAPSTTGTAGDSTPTDIPALPSGSVLPSFPAGSGVPSFLFPSGAAFPSGFGHHHHGRPHHSGGFFPSGFGAHPTGSFGFGFGQGGNRPSGAPVPSGFGMPSGVGGERPSAFAVGSGVAAGGAGKTPCTFETRVRPTATAALQ